MVTPPPSLPPRSHAVSSKKKKGKGKHRAVHHQHAESAPAVTLVGGSKAGKVVPAELPRVDLLRVLAEIDDRFLKASESAGEVSKVLEANRMHYHSNFVDTRGHIDHSARVMKIITWNRSFKGMQNAWEKKLYDEVKAGELMKLEYQRKVALLNRQKKNNAATEVLEKTKAAVTHLHTRYIVDMQSMDSTVAEIEHLRDNQLYPRLLDLADRMAKMWEDMHIHHENQLKTVLNLKSVDISDSHIETSDHHHNHTRQLHDIVEKWNTNFSDLMNYQKEYIKALYSWLKLNLIPIESSLKEKVASPPRMQQPPVKVLLHVWNELLTKLHDDLAKTAIGIDVDPESGEGTSQKDAVAEKRFAVESLKSKLDDEVEAHNKLSKQVREKSLSILKAHLPELFRALTDFSHASFEMYSKLRLMSLMQDQGNN
ncbi:hypothetical protein GUJ93_ZPchr0585g33750 [Zizania palustris]|uniref:DUF632 domain-containing protein n=1 Tax=Zizania palustris TaxID=103762 RepID=A0A8J5RD73_ZIZPA|nr:hypothetical protein GUJ93_ZPchr0585g33750 [Zizania palustris]